MTQRECMPISIDKTIMHDHVDIYDEKCDLCTLSLRTLTGRGATYYKEAHLDIKILYDLYLLPNRQSASVKKTITLKDNIYNFSRAYDLYHGITIRNVKNCVFETHGRHLAPRTKIYPKENYYNEPFQTLLSQEKLALTHLRKNIALPKEIVSKIKGYINSEFIFPFHDTSPFSAVVLCFSNTMHIKYTVDKVKNAKPPQLTMICTDIAMSVRSQLVRSYANYKLLLDGEEYWFNECSIYKSSK